jgi:hypothetical protein
MWNSNHATAVGAFVYTQSVFAALSAFPQKPDHATFPFEKRQFRQPW